MKKLEGSSGLTVLQEASVLPLGVAWGGSSVNVVPFRQDALVTSNGTQYFSYFGQSGEVVVGSRDLSTDELRFCNVTEPSECRPWDSHNCISLGLDECGHIHLAYDHHASKLKYRRSQNPSDISAWLPEEAMTGVGENQVTYPTFISSSNAGQALLFFLREGVWYSGAIRLKKYSCGRASWRDIGAQVVSGADRSIWTANPYFNRIVRDRSGVIHISYVWRSKAPIGDDLVNNVNICYLKSKDEGETWSGTADLTYPLPVTPVISDVIWPVPPGQNLMNQCGMDVDRGGNPHIVYYANDDSGIPQYFHLWLKDGAWRRSVVTRRTIPFSLKGKGTLVPPISRPQIVVSETGRVIVLGRLDDDEPGLSCFWADGPDYGFDSTQRQMLIKGDLGSYEPVVDIGRIRSDRILSLYLQRVQENGRDLESFEVPEQAYIIDMPLANVGNIYG